MSFQLAPEIFWWAELISQFFCKLNSSKYFICPSVKLRTEFTSLIAKSTSPRLLDTTFFASCWGRQCAHKRSKSFSPLISLSTKVYSKIKICQSFLSTFTCLVESIWHQNQWSHTNLSPIPGTDDDILGLVPLEHKDGCWQTWAKW